MTLYRNIENFNSEEKGDKLYTLIKQLYPICRSITGDGIRETLNIISNIIPITIHEIPTGTATFDWEIPKEWNIRDAWIKNSKGEKIIDFKDLNLHVLNYSIPIDKKVNLKVLKENLFTLPEYPDWVPYRTSYHTRQWGFCMSHNQMEALKEDDYHVYIDSSIEKGSLTYGEYLIEGKSKEEVLITCHICHPSLCNDNLSGISVAVHLAELLSKTDLNFTYRFLFIPGTIGSITWLSQNEHLVDNIKHGLVLTLLGDASDFYYKKTRRGDTEIDKILEYILSKNSSQNQIIEFSPYGYDERQFCSPGFNLAVGRLSRKPHGEFPEYHTSADNLDFVKPDRLAEAVMLLLEAVFIIENNHKYLNQSPKCEPQLGKRGLYKSIGGQSGQKDFQMALLWILNLSDGNYSMLDIANKSGLNFKIIKLAADELLKAGLLK